jgi:hypothetical protein
MAITFSRMGDTASSLTHDLLGHNNEDFAQKLWQQNASFNCRRLGVAGRFAPGYAVWVPEAKHPMGTQASPFQMPHFDALMPQHLEHLAAAQAYGFNPEILLGAHELACRLNYDYFTMAATHSDDSAEKSNYLDQAASFVLTASHTGIDVRKNVSKDMAEKMKSLNKAVLDERSYRRSKSAIKYLDKEVLEKFRTARIMAMKDMQKVNETFFSDRQATYLLHKSEQYWDHAIGREKWHLSNVFDTADLASAAEMMEHVANGLIVVDAGLAIHNVYEKWKEGDDWEYELIQDAVDLVVSVGIGLGVAALFTGGGWVVCLIAGATAGVLSWGSTQGLNYLGQHYLEPYVQKLREAA